MEKVGFNLHFFDWRTKDYFGAACGLSSSVYPIEVQESSGHAKLLGGMVGQVE